MKAQQLDDSGNVLKIRVTDNKGNIHNMGINSDDEVEYHKSDDYPNNPSSRSKEQNERIAQAREFGKYWVCCKHERQTVEPRNNPMYIDSVRKVISRMDLPEFATVFDELYRQQEYERGHDEHKVISVPEDIEEFVYGQDFKILGSELERERMRKELLDEHSLDVTKSLESGDILPEESARWNGSVTRSNDIYSDLEHDFFVDDIDYSGIFVMVKGGHEMVKNDESDGLDCPDATLEVTELESKSMTNFMAEIEHHLSCQIRDTLVRMGVKPPEEFRVLGEGKYMATKAYKSVDFYPELHDTQLGDMDENDDSMMGRLKSVFDSDE